MSPYSAVDDNDDDEVSLSNSSTRTSCTTPLHHHHDDNDDDDYSSSSSISSTSSSLSTTTTTTKKGVKFADCIVDIHFIIHKNDYSEDEISASWYTKDEIRGIKNGVRADVQIFTETPDACETDNYCPRGIECRTKLGAREKRHLKIDARAAVFFEQSVQQEGVEEQEDEEQEVDEEEIADAYYEYSQVAATKAAMLGMRDEQAAKMVYNNNDDDDESSMMRMTSKKSFSKTEDSFSVMIMGGRIESSSLDHVRVIASSAA